LARVVLLGHDQEDIDMLRQTIETTLWDLAHAIREVSSSDDEAFAVLERMIAEGRVAVCTPLPTAA
jgi:hypothetical protein